MPGLPPGSPSSWRDYADRLSRGQIDILAQREWDGWNPAMLFCLAQDLAASNSRRR
jgi:hypothetical protein